MATVKLDPAKGIQIPNLTTTERNAISSPETGAIIWNTTTSEINQYNGSAWEITYTPVAGISSSADATAITINSSEQVGIGTTSPDSNSKLHVYNGASGQSSATNNTEVVIENNSTTGISFLTPNNASSGLWFADPESNASGRFYYTHSDNSLNVFTGGTQRLKIDGDGLKFNSDTAAANALDDYEEGTWSPVFNVTSGSVTMHSSRDVGRYTKIGRVVQIQGQFSTGTASSPSGTFTISGLPFANGSDVDLSEEFLFFISANNIVNNSGKPLIGYVGASSSTITVYNQDGNNLGAAGNVLQSNSYLGFTATYTI